MQERQFQWVLREYGNQESVPTQALLHYLQQEAQVRTLQLLFSLEPSNELAQLQRHLSHCCMDSFPPL